MQIIADNKTMRNKCVMCCYTARIQHLLQFCHGLIFKHRSVVFLFDFLTALTYFCLSSVLKYRKKDNKKILPRCCLTGAQVCIPVNHLAHIPLYISPSHSSVSVVSVDAEGGSVWHILWLHCVGVAGMCVATPALLNLWGYKRSSYFSYVQQVL